jgi:hypothetical protein
MLKLIRLKLLIVPVAVCLLLFVVFSGTAFASSSPHPHISGPGNVKVQASTGCANIPVQGSSFTPSGEAEIFAIASTNGGFGNEFLPVGSDGTFSTVLVVCGFYALPSSVQYIAQDEPFTGFYSNTVTTTVKP